MLPNTLKRALIKLLIVLLRFDQQRTRLLDFLDRWPFVERRREVQQGLILVGDRRGLVELPALTMSLKLTILACVGLVLAFALSAAALGWPETLLTIPLFMAYLYLVLFARTLALKVKQWRET
jgi:hypothetical protein